MLFLRLVPLLIVLAAAGARADDRPQPSSAPPPGISVRPLPYPSAPQWQQGVTSTPSVEIDPRTGTSTGEGRDRMSDERGIPLSPLGDRPPGLSRPER